MSIKLKLLKDKVRYLDLENTELRILSMIFDYDK
jgi:hypothetical protein